jgi:geranylgeranyl pyrophosphate synthase
MHLSFYLWDDMLDNARLKMFKPTLFGKFGETTTLVIGGVASAKAFTILNETKMDKEKRHKISEIIWNLWTKMAKAETVSNNKRSLTPFAYRAKLAKIKMEAVDTETCLKIGAIVGNGSQNEINHLGKYGFCLGVISALLNDFLVSANLTLELSEKIRQGKLPYTLLWACSRSQELYEKIEKLAGLKTADQPLIREIAKDMMETDSYFNAKGAIERYARQGNYELVAISKNNATQTLKSYIRLQPSLFSENLSKFYPKDS